MSESISSRWSEAFERFKANKGQEGVSEKRGIFQSPEHMLDWAVKYFTWMDQHPLKEETVFHYQGNLTYANTSKMRAYTMTGFWAFTGITSMTYEVYKAQEPFTEVCLFIEQCVRLQKFEGAAAGMLNATIISRDLGLAERSELSGPGGGPVETITQYQLPSNGRDDAEAQV